MEWKIQSNKLLLFCGIVEKGIVKFFKKHVFWKKILESSDILLNFEKTLFSFSLGFLCLG